MFRNRAKELRNQATRAERLLWWHLCEKKVLGFKFRRQHPLGPYILDFVCLSKKIIIELDGESHKAQRIYDAERSRWLLLNGFKVLRFWNNDVMKSPFSVVDRIKKEIL